MFFDTGSLFALTILVAVTGIVVRVVIGSWYRRGVGGASATDLLAKMEERIQRIEEATSGLIAEFAAVRERERFMTQLVESRARKDARAAEASPASPPAAAADELSPFVVQTVSAVRRVANPGGPR